MPTFINTAKLKDYIPHAVALERAHFGNQAFDETQVAHWYNARRFFYAGAFEGTQMVSSVAMLLVDEDNFQTLLKGGHESQMQPYQLASRKVGYLYLGGMIIGNKHHTPYLYHSICRDIVQCAKTEDIPIRYAFSVPMKPSVERLLTRYGFKQEGLYRGQYPISVAPTVGHYMWQAFLKGCENGEG